MTRRPILLACALLLLFVPSASAELGWGEPELGIDANTESAAVAPDGTALLFGWPASGRKQLAVRPRGGPIGAPAGTTVYSNYDAPEVAFDAAGNALGGSRESRIIAYRPAGGQFGTTQSLSTFGYPLEISMAPSGEAMVGTDNGFTTNGAVKVAFRPAGPDAQVDVANEQVFSPAAGTYLRLLGLQMDPDGAAIVVMGYGDTVYQAVRAAGEASFGAPTAIPQAAGVGDDRYRVVFHSDPAGHAVLAYRAGAGNANDTHAVAAYRAPGGSFGTPQVVGAAGAGLHVNDVRAAVNRHGDGLVAWTETSEEGDCASNADPNVYAVHGSKLHGGSFGAAAPLGPGTYPETSVFEQVTAAGDRVALAYTVRHRGTRCDVTDNSSDVRVRTYRSEPSGLVQEDDRLLADSEPSGLPAGQGQWRHPHFGDIGVVLGAGGTLIAATGSYSGGSLVRELHVREDPDAPADPGDPPADPGDPPTDPGGSPTGPVGGTPTPTPTQVPVSTPTIKPIVPRDLVTPRPITRRKTRVPVTCPPEVGSDCATHMALYRRFGALPRASASGKKRKRKAVRLASGRATIAPGATKRVKLKLTKAGKRAAKRRASTGRLVVTVTADGRTTQSVVKVKIGKAKKKRKR